ncbi:outer membrane beta-barrel protein [Lacibacter sp. MH-610]|uniref:outer membrane beta-barrel protein n=1 Tax=Lacibacter sp. MH-610 TaxID=3020883 RepID=UPI003891BAD5
MDNRSFEEEVQQRMNELKLTPSAPVWAGVDAALHKDKRRRWFFYLLFAGVLLGTGTWVFYTTGTRQSKQQELAVNDPSQTTNKQNTTIAEKNKIDINNSTESKSSVNHPKPLSSQNRVENNIASNEKSPLQLSKKSIPVKKTVQQQSSHHQEIAAKPKTESTVMEDAEVKTAVAPVQQGKTPVVEKKEPDTLQNNVDQKSEPQIVVADTVSNKDSIVSAPVSIPAAKPVVKKPNWQSGFQLNGGVADISQSLVPRANFFSSDLSGTNYVGPTGVNYPGIIIKENTVNHNIQFGFGYLLRRSLNKRFSFATGIHYQYSSFKVNQFQRIDTFSTSQNRLVNAVVNESTTNFSLHYLQVPTELQWKIAGNKKGYLMLNTGLLHHIRLAGTSAKPPFADSSSRASFYQPLLQVAPSYEWKMKDAQLQIGWYLNYGLLPVYKTAAENHWWQTGLRIQYYLKPKGK